MKKCFFLYLIFLVISMFNFLNSAEAVCFKEELKKNAPLISVCPTDGADRETCYVFSVTGKEKEERDCKNTEVNEFIRIPPYDEAEFLKSFHCNKMNGEQISDCWNSFKDVNIPKISKDNNIDNKDIFIVLEPNNNREYFLFILAQWPPADDKILYYKTLKKEEAEYFFLPLTSHHIWTYSVNQYKIDDEDDDAKPIIWDIKKRIKIGKTYIHILGFADNEGSAEKEKNLKTSRKRVYEWEQFIKKKKFNNIEIKRYCFGNYMTTTRKLRDHENNLNYNRRVEIYISFKEKLREVEIMLDSSGIRSQACNCNISEMYTKSFNKFTYP